MNITIIYPHKRKTKSSTYGIAQMVLDRLLSGGTLHEFYLPQDMPHVCAGCYACMNGREDKCGGHEYMQKLIAAIDDSELIVSVRRPMFTTFRGRSRPCSTTLRTAGWCTVPTCR